MDTPKATMGFKEQGDNLKEKLLNAKEKCLAVIVSIDNMLIIMGQGVDKDKEV